jgi:hypothetical protein
MTKEGGAIFLARKEWKKESNEKRIYFVLLFLTLLGLFLLSSVLLIRYFGTNGFVTISSKAGDITELKVTSTIPVNVWGGFYGLVLRVPGFTELLSKDLSNGEIQRSDVFFDCLKLDAKGGPEIYASTNPALDLLTATVTPASAEMIDQYIDCTDNEVFCAGNTFTKNMTIYLGSQEIDNVPSTYTLKYTGEGKIFDIGALNVSNELVFVAHVNATIQKGFNPNNLVNYQMLLPTPENTTQEYYFYSDPFDVCPAGGGIGNTINVSMAGTVYDSFGAPIDNATITLAGYSTQSDETGFYNLSSLLLEGTYNVVAQKKGFKDYIDQINITIDSSAIDKNIIMAAELSQTNTLNLTVYGKVTDTASSPLFNVSIYFGNSTTTSSYLGDYNISSYVHAGQNPIFAIKQDYDNYYSILNITDSTGIINQNITLEPANLNRYPTGPYTQDKQSDITQQVKEQAEKAGQDNWISTKEIDKQVRENTFIEDAIDVYNFKKADISLFFQVSPEIQDIVKMDKTLMSVAPDGNDRVTLTISGTKPVGIYRGTITISGDINQEIPVKIEIVPQTAPIQNMRMELSLYSTKVSAGDDLRYKLNLKNLISDNSYQVYLKYLILNSNGTKVYYGNNETVELKDTLDLVRQIPLLSNLSNGEYQLAVEANYLNLFSTASAPFTVSTSIYLYAFFGVKLWIIFLGMFIFGFLLFNLFLYRMRVNKNKRYHLDLDINTLPKPGEHSVKLGMLAERKIPAYYNLDDLTTHAIVAGATGGGKSISAQVFVEEALMKNIAVVVFDPTAQWSGMLRKCDDKRMLSFYPKFGLKETDAKAFPGNIREVTNERQSIDIKKYMNPGKIEVFTMNKLTPPQIDIFVAGVISNIFKSDPQEYPNLKVLLVFDEVHRLLPKFGGSGKGFLQIERACREFRKWGFGVMLVSQVLSDFVGEIKANINTEVQMRVAEENDLERIKERYGEDALKSLVRADVGTGMIQNAEYNKGQPYFVSLRPILHNTRRLSDEILEKYNHYNDIIEDVEYQIEQIETYKTDVSDLTIELKLVKDKLMIGNFTVVDIYLEGLLPKLEKVWDRLGKKPKRKQAELINVSELESSLIQAKKAREQWEKSNPVQQQTTQVSEQKKSEKIVAPFTFNNGMMISSLKELNETLPGIEKAILFEHMNKRKNEIATWVAAQIDAGLGNKMKKEFTKEEIAKEIAAFIDAEKGKGKEQDKDEVKNSKK